KVNTVPAVSANNWVGSWAEDTNTPTPTVLVSISRSQKAAGQFAVEIVERVDPRFNIKFEAAADPVTTQTSHVFPFTGNVFGTVRPWVSHPFSPTDLRVAVVPKALTSPTSV